ncbi:maleylpyruvate isomerase family mycothiol-dependent enzyme [Streptomyces sp. H27-D2]|uniref:maleylpyruvate isomerase family mycothiol-dependent enzyme n=1 Tax=Streptomyces sp. H27-D2 TaxID=3046304 RepID=UPI002DBF6D58|nr:maleylpyruvate isomerase family mycothiol-dependent enzyme [Streptomyces sp. H27-D2]MEC4019470.1 maleylpyruvate isomerase family mycothiol-dependent enzyme [Streptomyces sp. H27-D2]
MNDHAHDLRSVHEATDRLLTAAAGLDDVSAAGPSRLPGWTRSHVLAHLARNADALTNLLDSAHTGMDTPMYRSEDARNEDIERDAHRPVAVHLDDLRSSAARFDAAAARLTDEQWQHVVAMRNGRSNPAYVLPHMRRVEIELHHVDLDVGYSMARLPAEFVDRQLDFIGGRQFVDRPGVPALLLRTDGEREWRTGDSAGDPVTVEGAPGALLGWLTGRTDGSGLSTPAAALPVLPPLG